MRHRFGAAALVVCAACSDPALAPLKEGLAEYDAGREALDAKDPQGAAAHFASARTRDPESVPLALWEAKARADAGDLPAADALLTGLIKEHPDLGVAWYNRAAYRVRAGRMVDAAGDLSQALTLGVRSPLEAAADADFAAARGEPAFAGILPAQPLEATAEGTDTIFVGSRYALTFRVVALPDAPLEVRRLGADPGCLAVSRVLQDDHVEAGKVTSTLTVELRAQGACDAALGPFEVTAGAGTRVEVPAVAVRVEAPEGYTAPTLPALPEVFPVPSLYAASDAGFRASRYRGIVAMGRPGVGLTATAGGGEKAPDAALEWRVDNQTRAVGAWWWIDGPARVSAGENAVDVP